MFFTHELLVGPSGRFALIWQAAMRKDKIKKRRVTETDIDETCKELVKYIRPSADSRMARVQGFSLRLSSQLVHGVVIIYEKKVDFLFREALISWKRLSKGPSLRLQIYEQPKPTVRRDSTEENYQLDLDLNADPLFGQISFLELDVMPEIPESFAAETSTSSDERVQRNVADLGDITLQEDLGLQHDRLGADLMTKLEERSPGSRYAVGDLQDIMTGINGEFESMFDAHETVASRIPELRTPSDARPPTLPKAPRRRRTADREADESVLAVPLEDEQPPAAEEVMETRQQQSREQEQPMQEVQQVHPPSSTSSLALEPLPPRDHFRVRKRRKLAIDSKIELDSDDMRKQLRSKKTTLDDYRDAGFLDEPLNYPPASVLFSSSSLDRFGYSGVRLQRAQGENSVQDLFRNTVQAITEHPEMSDPIPLGERSAEEVKGVSFEASRLDDTTVRAASISRSGMLMESRESIELQKSSISDELLPQLGPMTSIQEELQGDLEQAMISDIVDIGMPIEPEISTTPLGLDISSSMSVDVQAEVEKLAAVKGYTEFSALAPPRLCSRSEAAKKFYKMLVCAKSGVLEIFQDEPYGPIRIDPVTEL